MVGLKAWVQPHRLYFKGPAGTSRGTLHEKQVHYLLIQDTESGLTGIGECTIIPGLSQDDRADYPETVRAVARAINAGQTFEAIKADLNYFPSIVFGLETAFHDLYNGGKRQVFNSAFARGEKAIKINGLIWMNDYETMREQIKQKIREGFDCLKLKIGSINWNDELALLAHIRADYDPADVEIRVDANGAFSPEEALQKLEDLGEFGVHSIEQPIPPRQPDKMALVCRDSHVPVALDEELIGRQKTANKQQILDTIRPHNIVIKPSLLGGFYESQEWVELAEDRHIGWWVTSALESNIGLNAIAEWVGQWHVDRPQGLGTGGLYTNNIPSPLEVESGYIGKNLEKDWDLELLNL